MKTRKKYTYFTFFGVLFWFFLNTFIVEARWYGREWKAVVVGGYKTYCDEDIHRDSIGPAHKNGGIIPGQGQPPHMWIPGGLEYYEHNFQARVISSSQNNIGQHVYMLCEKWDSTKPETKNISYHNGWTKNKNIEITLEGTDYGGSFYEVFGGKIELQMKTSTNGPDFSNWSGEWIDISNSVAKTTVLSTISDLKVVYTYTAPETSGTAYKFRYRVIDGAGNESDWVDGVNIYKLDTKNPDPNNIGVRAETNDDNKTDTNTGDNSSQVSDNHRNFMAGEESPIQIIYKNTDGSPIAVHYNIEDDNNSSQMNNGKVSNGFRYRFSLDEKFKKVDNDLNSNGGRPIAMKIIKIVDEAGNETTVNKTYTFNVFANIIQQITANPSESGTKIADGSENVYTREILDNYGNKIIHAPSIGRVISRTTTTTENTMYLNQKTRTGDTSVYVKSDSASFTADKLPKPNESIKKDNIIPQAGTSKYDLILQVYTPTAIAYQEAGIPVSDPNARFSLKSAIIVKDDQKKIRSIASRELTSFDINNPVYKPLFTNQITGDLRDGGFIEGAEQTSSVVITTNPDSPENDSLLEGELSYEYKGDNADKFSLFLPYNNNFTDNIFEFKKDPTFKEENYYKSKQYRSINTLLKQKSGDDVEETSKIQLSTHFVYQLDNKNITYNGDIIGKAHYHDGNTNNSATQAGVKIIGTVANSKLNTILANQKDDLGNQIAESLDSSVRDEINKSIAIATRNIDMKSAGTDINDVKSIPSGRGTSAGSVSHDNNTSILVIDAQGNTINLTAQAISGKRTIVIRGGNLHITNDMYYSDNNSILGVVIQKDSQGRGGNLYIHPDVTNIVGSYVMEGSVMSYDGTNEISVGNIATLKNQLHIYGTIISHNTIGGSRANPLKCPAFVTAANCDQNPAQKYDLNFLRRYYLWNNKPFGDAKVIGGETVNNAGIVTGKNNNLKQLFTKTSDDLAKYPLIIEYDANILTNPPIGFEAYRE